jgi:hypothetical protein
MNQKEFIAAWSKFYEQEGLAFLDKLTVEKIKKAFFAGYDALQLANGTRCPECWNASGGHKPGCSYEVS